MTKFISILFIGLFTINANAMDVMPLDLAETMFKKAQKRVHEICGSKKNAYMPTNYQVHDSYTKYEGDADEGGTFYYYSPKATGSAYCKKSKILIQWTAKSDLNTDGKLEYDELITTISKLN